MVDVVLDEISNMYCSITYKSPHRHSLLKYLFVRLPHAKHSQFPNLHNCILSLYPQSFGIEVRIEGDNGDEHPQKSRSAVQHLQSPTINHKAEPLTIFKVLDVRQLGIESVVKYQP